MENVYEYKGHSHPTGKFFKPFQIMNTAIKMNKLGFHTR